MARSNVLVVMTDQQTASAMSCAGNPYLDTPALDGLAARGTRFNRAYCPQPLCAPSRASMLTGRMPSDIGVTINGPGLPPEHRERSLGRWFDRAGYDCGYAGKWHLPELSVPEDAGFRRVHGAPENGLADACRAFLAEPRSAPFLLVASLTEPHGICQWARGQVPPSGPVPAVARDRWPPLRPNHAVAGYDAELPRLAQRAMPHTYPTRDWGDDAWRAYLHAYYRLCERADAQVGRLLDALEETGHGADTLIVFTSDHGDQIGAHRWNQKWVLHEESLAVPLIVVPPGGGGGCDDRLVNVGLDLLPTVCDHAGVPAPEGLPGRSLRGTPDTWRDAVFAETTWEVPGVPHLTGRSVRSAGYRYVCYAWGGNREQLFRLDADPGEMCNLATTGAHRAALDRHRERLREELSSIGDPFGRFLPAPGSDPA